jgi:hypothetical protein
MSHREQLRHIREHGSINTTPKKVEKMLKKKIRQRPVLETINAGQGNPQQFLAVPLLTRLSVDL